MAPPGQHARAGITSPEASLSAHGVGVRGGGLSLSGPGPSTPVLPGRSSEPAWLWSLTSEEQPGQLAACHPPPPWAALMALGRAPPPQKGSGVSLRRWGLGLDWLASVILPRSPGTPAWPSPGAVLAAPALVGQAWPGGQAAPSPSERPLRLRGRALLPWTRTWPAPRPRPSREPRSPAAVVGVSPTWADTRRGSSQTVTWRSRGGTGVGSALPPFHRVPRVAGRPLLA